ncbi:DNA N-6-adenine-methyltransferase [Halorhabdus rudnickae]|uniref:DNA N-6-adenine-methyltransferase n=1 Tax=Halorhabdus rudnickae TaxID=1775544 RepID=UPI00108366A5|nr:DNA N-6-adenine-methyltransferase [Halorhabdus rudnickae]
MGSQTQLPTGVDAQHVSEGGSGIREGQYDYATRLEDFQPIAEAVRGFDLDPCASDTSTLAETNIRNEGGLLHDWGQYGTVWLNHPFADPEPWLKKAVESDADLVVALSKADPSTDWFHEYVLEAGLICFPEERFKFAGFEKGADFPIVLTAFGEFPAALREHFESLGWVAVDGDGFNEIRPTSNPVLPDISRADRIRVRFPDPVEVGDKHRQTVTLVPLVRRERDSGVFELTAVFQHDDGTETWFSLSQSGDGSEVICRKHDREHGFEHVFVDQIVVPTNQRGTHPPSSAMHVR